MGKLVFKMVVMLAIVVGVSNYALYIMTGKSPFTGDGPKLSFSAPSPSSLIPKGKQQAYKWTDEHGVVHYSEAPPAHIEAERLDVDPNTNMIQGLRKKEKETDETATATPPAAPTLPQGSVYNPETIRKLIDDAKQVQETMNARTTELEKY